MPKIQIILTMRYDEDWARRDLKATGTVDDDETPRTADQMAELICENIAGEGLLGDRYWFSGLRNIKGKWQIIDMEGK